MRNSGKVRRVRGGRAEEEHRALVAPVGQLAVLLEAELEAQHHASRSHAPARLAGVEPQRRAALHEPAEVRAVDAVAEARPAEIPAADGEEPGGEAGGEPRGQ